MSRLNSTLLISKPMTVSCITALLEKQIVLQAKRLGSDVEVFTLNLLGIALTHTVLLGVQVTFISPPVISVVAADIEGAEERFEFCQHVIFTSAKHVRQDGVGGVIHGILQPAWISLAPDKRPLLVHFYGPFQPHRPIALGEYLTPPRGIDGHESARFFSRR